MFYSRRCLKVVFLGIVLLEAIRPTFAQFHSINLEVDQFPQVGSEPTYRLEVFLEAPFASVPITGVSAVAPDGTEFGFAHSLLSIERNSIVDLGSTLFGDWTVTENPTVGPAASYTVRVEPFTLSDVISGVPAILSPLDGATVPTDFVVTWEEPASGLTYGFSPNLTVPMTTRGVDGPYSVRFQTGFAGPVPGQMTLRVYTTTRLPTPPIISRDPAFNGISISRELIFNSNSLPATYQVVPEPSTFASGGIVLCACASSLRLRDSRRRRPARSRPDC